jgi:putative ABC transport system permease protein
MRERLVSENSISKLGIRDFNMDVYAPLQSVLIRYQNRDLITTEELRLANMRSQGLMMAPANLKKVSWKRKITISLIDLLFK